MRSSQWKTVERKIAALLGGTRVPVTGRGRGSAPDIAHDTLALEVKHRKEIPLWLEEALSQALACASEGRPPVVIVHRAGWRYDESLVVMPMASLRELIGASGG